MVTENPGFFGAGIMGKAEECNAEQLCNVAHLCMCCSGAVSPLLFGTCAIYLFSVTLNHCLHSAPTSAGRFVGGKQLHLTFCFLHRVSDNINSLLVASKIVAQAEIISFLAAVSPQAFPAVFTKMGQGFPASVKMGIHGPLPMAKLSLISAGTRE